MARMLCPELSTKSNYRPDRHLTADINHQVKLLLLFKHNHTVQKELSCDQSKRNILSVLETIANKKSISTAL
uniref:Uncharacterized protein n=1 Tax=Solanum lycopersicum TaxID=4081 RepID=A0A3Q7EVD2_SOLLC